VDLDAWSNIDGWMDGCIYVWMYGWADVQFDRLLTIPWFLSVFGGRVDIVDDHCTYKKPINILAGDNWSKLSGTRPFWTGTGTEPEHSAIRQGAYVMLVTCIPYLLIQGAQSIMYHLNITIIPTNVQLSCQNVVHCLQHFVLRSIAACLIDQITLLAT
jgi:hypothetical protein